MATEGQLRAYPRSELIGNIQLSEVRGRGITYPKLEVILKARTERGIEFEPLLVQISAFLEIEKPVQYALLGSGLAAYPIHEIHDHFESQIVAEIPLNERAIKLIESNLRDDYLGISVHYSGYGKMSVPGKSVEKLTQLINEPLGPLQLSKIDWIKKVLEPIGYPSRFILDVPIPKVGNNASYTTSLESLERATTEFLEGHDRPVFAACYDAFDTQIYDQRETLLNTIDNDQKRSAIGNVIETVHRFTNGGRHLPAERATSGGFEVDHIDAEFARILTTAAIAYISKRTAY